METGQLTHLVVGDGENGLQDQDPASRDGRVARSEVGVCTQI